MHVFKKVEELPFVGKDFLLSVGCENEQKHQIASIKLRSFKEVLDCSMFVDKTVLIKIPSYSLEWENIPLKNQQDTSNIKIDERQKLFFLLVRQVICFLRFVLLL